MEGNCRSDRPPPSADIDRANVLNRSNSDTSSLTAEDCKDILSRSANVTLDDSTTWTDEKHRLYLNRLELSFVKQLHKSMDLQTQYSEQKQRDKNKFQMRPINVHNASEQYGCWQKINHERASHTSADSHDSLKSPWKYRFKRVGMHCRPPSADMPEFLKLCSKENHGKGILSHRLETCSHGKGILSHGLETCSQQFPASNRCFGDLYDLTREGTDQNFVDEDNQNKSNQILSVERKG